MDSLAFIESIARAKKLHPIYALHGDEAFLKRQALAALRETVFGPGGDDMGWSAHAGEQATFAAVVDELRTAPFLAPRRVVVVEAADPFVTRYRQALEKLAADPPASGVLVLEVKSWPANTRLAKLLPTAATISCKAPTTQKLADWCIAWATSRHGKRLTPAAARALVELIDRNMGVLDQELAKLAAYVGKAERIDASDVDEAVGGGREANVFEIFDALGAGRHAESLAILERSLAQGQDPMRILGAFSHQLRMLARAAALVRLGRSPAQAAEEAGFPPFARQARLQQLRALADQAARVYDRLLEVDLGLKGASPLPPRTQLERLLVRLFPTSGPQAVQHS